jgi:hypothetical protein
MRFQQTLIGGGELLALLRPLWCFLAVVSFGQGVGLLPAWAAPSSTITTLALVQIARVGEMEAIERFA